MDSSRILLQKKRQWKSPPTSLIEGRDRLSRLDGSAFPQLEESYPRRSQGDLKELFVQKRKCGVSKIY